MESIDAVRINFDPGQLFLLNICLAILMFGVALDLRFDHFRSLFRHFRKPLIGLISQWILLPVLTMLLIFALRPAPSVALGMLLVASCPGGNVSNYAVHLSGGNTALSVIMTSISTLGAILLTPIYFAELSRYIPNAAELRSTIAVNPVNMFRTILQIIVLPLLAGMLASRYLPRLTSTIRQPIKILSMMIFISFVVFAIYGNFDSMSRYLHIVFWLVLIHNALALAMGYGFASINRLSIPDRRAIAIETGIQNSGLGLILIFNFFDGLGGMALIAAWWGVWHLISAFGLAILWGRRGIAEELRWNEVGS